MEDTEESFVEDEPPPSKGWWLNVRDSLIYWIGFSARRDCHSSNAGGLFGTPIFGLPAINRYYTYLTPSDSTRNRK